MAGKKKNGMRVEQRPAWLLERLRKTLKFQKDKAEFTDGKPLTWPGFCEAVEEQTGVRVPHERLRQFVEGVVDAGTGLKSFPVPRPERIEAIIETITDPEDPWITRSALERPDFETRPPACLLELLTDSLAPQSASKLHGTFTAHFDEDHEFEDVALTFESFDLPGMVHVRERRVRHGATTRQSLDLMQADEKIARHLATLETSGWGVLTAEDQVIVMMRNMKTGAGHRWLLVGHADFWSDIALDRLVFLRQDYPYDLDIGDGALAAPLQIQKQMVRDVLTFEREGKGDV